MSKYQKKKRHKEKARRRREEWETECARKGDSVSHGPSWARTGVIEFYWRREKVHEWVFDTENPIPVDFDDPDLERKVEVLGEIARRKRDHN